MGLDLYDGTQEPDYNEPYQWAPLRPRQPGPVTVDHNLQLLRAESGQPDAVTAWIQPPVGSVTEIQFDLKPRQTSNAGQNSRDLLWFGRCESATETLPVWGFQTYQEWRDHLAPQDADRARRRRAVMTDTCQQAYLGTGMRFHYWVAKRGRATAPDFWALSAEWPGSARYWWIWANQQEWILERRATGTNTIHLGK